MAGSPHSASAQETDTLRVPHIEHPALEGHEILLGPPLVVAYELGSLGKLVAVEARSKGIVAIATLGQLLAYAGKILLGMQTARMAETAVDVLGWLRHGSKHRTQQYSYT